MNLRNGLRALVYGTVVVLGLWAFWLEPDSIRVAEHDLPLVRWPKEQAGLRIAVIADLHAGSPYIDRAKIARIVELTNAARPDLILLAGDYVINGIPFGTFIPVEDSAAILAGLRAPLGVYAVTGNHEHRLDDAVSEHEAFARHGIALIDNRMVHIESGRWHFWLAGFDEIDEPLNIPYKQLAQAGDGNGDPVIGLIHNPLPFHDMPKRVNLVIAGHTHGGQVNLPLLGPVILHAFDRPGSPEPFQAGHYIDVNDLFISTGIGTSNLGVRFLVPPEISLLTLHPYE